MKMALQLGPSSRAATQLSVARWGRPRRLAASCWEARHLLHPFLHVHLFVLEYHLVEGYLDSVRMSNLGVTT
jgi:hypothetical protein